MAIQDLIGLSNKVLFYNRFKQAMKDSIRYKKLFALIIIDLDNYKDINDKFGYEKADIIFNEIEKRITSSFKNNSDEVVRAEDEFIVLIQDLYSKNIIEELASKIHSSFQQPIIIDNNEIYITAKIGYSIFPDDKKDDRELNINDNYSSLFTAKEKGNNKVMFFEDLDNTQKKKRLELTNELYYALERNQFELIYQPQINSLTGKIIAVEALIRWNLPKFGVLYPDDFIPIAEKTGSIVKIGEWVIKTACMQNKAWQDAGLAQMPVAVNISTNQFDDLNLMYYIEKALYNTGLLPKYLELDLTEDISMKKMNNTIKTLKQFKSLGLGIAMDDFGTAYSSLNNLKQIPLDTIKINKCFIDGINNNNKDEAIIKTIISLARNIGLKVIAVGVEKKHQLDFLMREKCFTIQGYYYYKPMRANEIKSILENEKSFRLHQGLL